MGFNSHAVIVAGVAGCPARFPLLNRLSNFTLAQVQWIAESQGFARHPNRVDIWLKTIGSGIAIVRSNEALLGFLIERDGPREPILGKGTGSGRSLPYYYKEWVPTTYFAAYLEGRIPPAAAYDDTGNLIATIGTTPDGLSAVQLRAIMPKLSEITVQIFLGPLNRAMKEFHITTPMRQAAFLAELAEETGELTRWEETATGDAYEGRAALGNTQAGDGRRFKGRGPIQLTGRTNYRNASEALHLDLINHPEWLADSTDPDTGFRMSAWFWDGGGGKDLNAMADAIVSISSFDMISNIINTGHSDKTALNTPTRQRYFRIATRLLGVQLR